MSYKIQKTKTQKELIDFKAEYLQDCKQLGYNLTFAEDDEFIYALEIYEILQNGEVVDISQTTEYINSQKVQKRISINLEYVDKFNAFDIMWSKNIGLGKKTTEEYIIARTNLVTELKTKLAEV